MAQQVCLVIGAGESTGAAIARRFAREGFTLCVARRNGDKLQPLVGEIEAAGGVAHGFGVDARKEDQMVDLVERIESEIGPIDTPFIRETFPDLVKERPADGILNPEDIAENYWSIHKQPRSAWTHEIELRPWLEPW